MIHPLWHIDPPRRAQQLQVPSPSRVSCVIKVLTTRGWRRFASHERWASDIEQGCGRGRGNRGDDFNVINYLIGRLRPSPRIPLPLPQPASMSDAHRSCEANLLQPLVVNTLITHDTRERRRHLQLLRDEEGQCPRKSVVEGFLAGLGAAGLDHSNRVTGAGRKPHSRKRYSRSNPHRQRQGLHRDGEFCASLGSCHWCRWLHRRGWRQWRDAPTCGIEHRDH